MIFLGIGSNLKSSFGNRFSNILRTLDLIKYEKIEVLKISNFYETPSYPNKKMPKFVNIGLTAEYALDEAKLIKEIALIEKKIGRVQSKKNDPRVCDIDIIDFNGLIKKDRFLELPHPRSHTRNFVLYPIKQIDPKWIHPILKKNVDFLIDELSLNSRIEITRLSKSVII